MRVTYGGVVVMRIQKEKSSRFSKHVNSLKSAASDNFFIQKHKAISALGENKKSFVAALVF